MSIYIPWIILGGLCIGLSVSYLLIGFGWLDLIVSIISGIMIWLICIAILMIGGGISQLLPLESAYTILIAIIIYMLSDSWKKMRRPIHEGIFTIHIIALLYFLLEKIGDNQNSIIYSIILLLIFCIAVFNNLNKKILTKQYIFFIILFNSMLMCIFGGIYTITVLQEITSLDRVSSLFGPQLFLLSFIFGYNILYILQQIFLVGHIIPDEKMPYRTVLKSAIDEFSKHYISHIQTNIKYIILVILCIGTCIVNAIFAFMEPIYISGCILFIASLLQNTHINSFFIHKK